MSVNIDSGLNDMTESQTGISENPNPSLSDPTLLESTLITHKFDFTEPDNETNIIKDGDTVKAATFSKLIELITKPDTDTNFLHDFVLTYRSFATPFDLLEGLTVRLQTATETNKRTISLRILNLFKHWFEKAWYDFEKDCPELYNRTVNLFDRMYLDESVKKVVQSVRTILDRKINGEDKSAKKTAAKMLRPILPKDPTCDILDINSEEIARQLTILEWEMWESIQPWECLSLSWMKKDKDVLAPNVIKMIERFNWVSGWVSSTICTIESLKKRSKAISKFIEIADRCFHLHNFNGVMEIVSGLNRGPVYRLKQAWENIPGQMKKTFDELKTLTDRAKNYANMRKHLKKVDPPLLPYLGIYLTDLTFIEEGNKNDVGGLINFKKRHQISETIRSIQQYQFKAYAIEKVEFIHDKLRNITIYDEDTLYELSEYLEPRPGKERGPRPLLLDKEFRKKNEEYFIPIDLEDINNTPYVSPDTPSNVVLEDGKIKSGTIEKIIEYLTHHVIVDSNGVFSFFFTYRTFVNPEKVLELLRHRFNVPPPKNKTPQNMEIYKNELLSNIQLRVFFALKTWIDKHYYDFASSESLKNMLIDFINGEILQATPKYAKTLLESLNKQGHNTITFMNEETPPPVLFSNNNLDIRKASILDFNSEEISRQLCLYHHQKFLNIIPYELLHKEDSSSEHLRIFLDTSKWFEVWIKEEMGKSDKLKVVEKFCEISSYCSKNSNLHASRTITSILMDNIKNESFGISLDLLPVNVKTELEGDYELFSNNNLLADKFESLSPPCIPSVEFYIDEIDTIEKTCGSDMLLDNKINFEKKRRCGETLKSMSELQKMKYIFNEVPIIQKYFHNLEIRLSYKEISPENSKKIISIMSDYIKNNQEFRNEIKSISLDMFYKKADKLRNDYKNLLTGKMQSNTFLEEKTVYSVPSLVTSTPKKLSSPKEGPKPVVTRVSDDITSQPIQKAPSNESISPRSPVLIKTNSISSNLKMTTHKVNPSIKHDNITIKQAEPVISSPKESNQEQVNTNNSGNQTNNSEIVSSPPVQKNTNPLTKENSTPNSFAKSPILTRHKEDNTIKNRSSFTAASKQQGIKDLLLSLGKSSGSIPFLTPQNSFINTQQNNKTSEQTLEPVQNSTTINSPTHKEECITDQLTNTSVSNHNLEPVQNQITSNPPTHTVDNSSLPIQNQNNIQTRNMPTSLYHTPKNQSDSEIISRSEDKMRENHSQTVPTNVLKNNTSQVVKRPVNPKLAKQAPKKTIGPNHDGPKKKFWGPKKMMKAPVKDNREIKKTPAKKLQPKLIPKESIKKSGKRPFDQGKTNNNNPQGSLAKSGNPKAYIGPKKKLPKIPPKTNPKLVKLPVETNKKTPPTQSVKQAPQSNAKQTPQSSTKQTPKLDFQERSINRLKTNFPGCKIEKWEYFDQSGVVYGSPANISIPTFILNERVHLCSIKESFNEVDITILIKLGKLYKSIHPSNPLSCLIVTKSISENSSLIAQKCKIKVYKIE